MLLAPTRALRDSGPGGCEGDYQSCTIMQFDTAFKLPILYLAMKHHTSLASKAHNKSSSRTFSRRHRSYRILNRANLHKKIVVKGHQITQRGVVKPVTLATQ